MHKGSNFPTPFPPTLVILWVLLFYSSHQNGREMLSLWLIVAVKYLKTHFIIPEIFSPASIVYSLPSTSSYLLNQTHSLTLYWRGSLLHTKCGFVAVNNRNKSTCFPLVIFNPLLGATELPSGGSSSNRLLSPLTEASGSVRLTCLARGGK